MEPYDPDRLLIQRVAQKNLLAFRELVGKHLHRCVKVAERMVGNRQDAEEIVQEVCLKIWNEAERWQPKAKFSTWLYRVLLNACIDHTRKIVPFAAVELETIADESPAVDDMLISGQSARRVRQALQRLPERQRAAVVLSYYEEMSNQEAADTLGMTLGAFQQLLFRAKQHLKGDLLGYFGEHGHG